MAGSFMDSWGYNQNQPWQTPPYNPGAPGMMIPSWEVPISQDMTSMTPGISQYGAQPQNAGFGQLGANLPTAQLALAGIGTIGNLWAAFKTASLAKKQFNYTKKVTDTNLANQIQTYNTSLEDRARSRAVVEGRDDEYTRRYIDTNSLKKWGG